jgi:phosphoserine/homoserine phosphotransferase
MKKLSWPTLFCNSLEVDDDGNVVDYHLRLSDGKRHAVLGFKQLNFAVIAIGDSYNDTSMLKEADLGILFRPSANVVEEFPQFPVTERYDQLEELIDDFARSY